MTKNELDIRLFGEVVEHWARIRYRNRLEGEFAGGEDCSLCKEYVNTQDDCAGCPIYTKTKENSCKGTPWEDFSVWELDNPDNEGVTQTASNMIEFLEDLKKEFEMASCLCDPIQSRADIIWYKITGNIL